MDHARTRRFLIAVSRLVLFALALRRETIEVFPDLDQGPTVHAALLHHNGFVAASAAIGK